MLEADDHIRSKAGKITFYKMYRISMSFSADTYISQILLSWRSVNNTVIVDIKDKIIGK